ncbi:hypothetical protein [Nonomuraea guangzhouensis]|uniref:Glycosyl transferase family 28 C-terminal domain-containing protein n=1 Tax=Nonomuraea guangzhouensis TaxID=1291555 RepID=A0ABW4GQY3_9ACTN|nr:hypothetical protein [Nonomuraea guangzhouensis]
MIVCYARGGGLGHLTRVGAYLHTVHPGAAATILTEWPGDPAALSRADEIVVDAFPAGLDGELDAAGVPPGVRVVHLARLLRWDAYRPLIPDRPLRFAQTWLAEPVSGPHLAYLRSVSDRIAPLALRDPPGPPAIAPGDLPGRPPATASPGRASVTAPEDPPGPWGVTAPGDWLIVHSGPSEEILELVAYARESAALEGLSPRLVLVSPAAPPGLPAEVAHLAVRPAWPLFATAGRIVSAAGFNVVRQAAPYRHKHRMVPFPRRFDDQFTRAARARRETT